MGGCYWMLNRPEMPHAPTVNFEITYFLNEETVGVLADTLMNFHDW